MERLGVEDEPLLVRGEADGASNDDGAVGLHPTSRLGSQRSLWRMRRADLACLSIMGFVASFLLVWQPPTHPIGSIMRNYHEDSQVTVTEPTCQYITYDDIGDDKRKNGYEVSYTKRGFVVDGKTTLLLGGSIHYARSTPAMWEDLLRKAKNDGLNHIELYVFWNLHEPTPDTFHFHERANLTQFYEVAAKVGLFLNVRFGPYACAEWNNGGLPYWLEHIPGMNVRSSAAPWKREMGRFVTKMVDLARPYLAKNGGPIIMAQIENEYDDVDDAYVDWCGQLTADLNTSIPWMMCNGKAATNTILTCNANDCIEFANQQNKARPNEPFMWTENEGWYNMWEHRPAAAAAAATTTPKTDLKENWEDRDPEEISYAIARWFAVGAAHHNYYMYHGGNNYGRTSSAGVTTKYADGVNLHSDGLSNEPKRSHLRKLHETLIACNHVLLANDRQIGHAQPLGGPAQLAYVYGSQKGNGDRVVFLENDDAADATITFDGKHYHLQPKSVVILKNDAVLFDTSAVRESFPHRQQRVYSELVPASSLNWEIWTERGDPRKAVVDTKPLEQLSITHDKTDYLIYKTTFTLSSNDKHADELVLNFTATDANAFLVVVDGKFVGEAYRAWPGDERTQLYTVKLPSWLTEDDRASAKQHELSFVSVGLGLFTLGKQHLKGITGDVTLNGKSLVGKQQWHMYPGLIGEHLKIYDPKWNASVPWTPYETTNSTRPLLSWYRTSFKLLTPRMQMHSQPQPRAKPVEETSSMLLDCVGLTRGHVYLNGHDLGRHWLIKDKKGDYVQRYYHIPSDWLRSDPNESNDLVVFDEIGGSIGDVRVVLSSMLEEYKDPENEIRKAAQRHGQRLTQSPTVATEERRAT